MRGSPEKSFSNRLLVILIDHARWWFNGRRWCHLISDTSVKELIDFADRNEIQRRAFQGDHYDIPEEFRERLIADGAVEVESREIARRLRAAGLRLSAEERRAFRRQRSSNVLGGVIASRDRRAK